MCEKQRREHQDQRKWRGMLGQWKCSRHQSRYPQQSVQDLRWRSYFLKELKLAGRVQPGAR